MFDPQPLDLWMPKALTSTATQRLTQEELHHLQQRIDLDDARDDRITKGSGNVFADLNLPDPHKCLESARLSFSKSHCAGSRNGLPAPESLVTGDPPTVVAPGSSHYAGKVKIPVSPPQPKRSGAGPPVA